MVNRALQFERLIATAVVLLPTLGFVLAITFYSQKIDAWDISLFIIFGVLSQLGINIGFHRYFVHKSFSTTKSIEAILIILGSMAGQGPLLFWAACHRWHHRYTDKELDPHSPVTQSKSLWLKLKKFCHAHIGWMFYHQVENWAQDVPDLIRNEFIFNMSKNYFYWVALGLIIPAVIDGVAHWSLDGILRGLLWGGLVRMFVMHHITWSTNSFGHLLGNRPFKAGGNSQNNFILGVITMGEGWHNNHHAFPRSARHGLYWWQIDISYMVIRLLEKCKLVSNIKLPSFKES